MPITPWENRAPKLVEDEAGVISEIHNASEATQRFAGWPSFHDAEIVSLHFDRGNHLQVVQEGDWAGRIPENLSAVFRIPADPPRQPHPILVTLAFCELHEVEIEGFNYQNPIVDLVIQFEELPRVGTRCFRVDWGGSMGHEVSILCGAIAVQAIQPATP